MDLLAPRFFVLCRKAPKRLDRLKSTSKVCTPTMDIRAEDTYSTWKRRNFGQKKMAAGFGTRIWDSMVVIWDSMVGDVAFW